jgi:hypothetical protein
LLAYAFLRAALAREVEVRAPISVASGPADMADEAFKLEETTIADIHHAFRVRSLPVGNSSNAI